MKILMSVYACSPYRGSEPGNGWNWCYNVAKAGYQVYCLTTPEGKADIEKKMNEEPIPNLTFIYIDVPEWVNRAYAIQAGVYFHYFYWQHLAVQKAKSLDKEVGIDIVHHVTYNSIQFGSELWKLKKPMIFGPSGGGQHSLPSLKKYFGKKWYQEILRGWISYLLIHLNRNTRNAVKRSHLFIASNEDTRDMAIKLGAKNVTFMIDSIPPESFMEKVYTPRDSAETLRLLWIGRLYPRKGLKLVLEVLGQLRTIIPFRLTIIGNGPQAKELPKWIAQNGLEAYVDWRGLIPFSDVKAAYMSHDIFFFTSLRDSCPPQLLEAMANGLPVVTLNIHGSKTMVPDNAGFKITPSTPQATIEGLKNALITLYQNPAKREELGRNGLAFALTQNWSNKVKEVTSVYDEIMKQ